QTQALQRLLEGDIDSPFPEAAGVSELDTISRLMEAFRANVRKSTREYPSFPPYTPGVMLKLNKKLLLTINAPVNCGDIIVITYS
ncbi:hypothetical protein MJL33_33725, partial [Salmonella enterica subsp. enterica serovar Kentucky]|nr:hypothetical protein [Salmonella enterica subsp. enterica serovar Kentucky]